MQLRRYSENDVRGKRVLVRADLNVPLKNGAVADETRIAASLPNIISLHEYGALVSVISHLGRPKGEPKPELRMEPVALALERLLQSQNCGVSAVTYASDCIGVAVEEAVAAQSADTVLLLENSRFYPGEEKNDPDFARNLAQPFDVFVNDAFGTAHRAHASTVGVAEHLPAFAGPLIVREVEALSRVVENPAKPFVVVLGGKKVSDKLPLLKNLCGRADSVLVGGAMVFTLARALGLSVGKSLVEEQHIDACRDIVADYNESATKLVLPEDVIVADSLESPQNIASRRLAEIEDREMGVDIGEMTRDAFALLLRDGATIFWNGPMGVFEVKPFDAGTIAVAEAIAGNAEAYSVVGGGESVEAVNQLGFAEHISHISTGGGASLEFVGGLELPGIKVLVV
jgi:phosphoglycerate kinase